MNNIVFFLANYKHTKNNKLSRGYWSYTNYEVDEVLDCRDAINVVGGDGDVMLHPTSRRRWYWRRCRFSPYVHTETTRLGLSKSRRRFFLGLTITVLEKSTKIRAALFWRDEDGRHGPTCHVRGRRAMGLLFTPIGPLFGFRCWSSSPTRNRSAIFFSN
jgi:hypothetical protein